MDSILKQAKQGDTLYGASSTATIPSSPYDFTDLEGTQALLPDLVVARAGVVKRKRSGRLVTARLVRNVSTIALLPGRAVVWKADFRNLRVDGYARVTGVAYAGIVDPHLPAAGVRVNDLFWLYQTGPIEYALSAAANAENVIASDAFLRVLTAAASTSVTAGRLYTWDGTISAAESTDGTETAKLEFTPLGKAASAQVTSDTYGLGIFAGTP